MDNQFEPYRSFYVWPNPAFPFRVYYQGKHLRIFIIENLQHNYVWLSKYRDKIREGDHFLVIVGWHWEENLINNANEMFVHLGLDKRKFFIMYNDQREADLFAAHGFSGEIINQNAWLDYNAVMRVIPEVARDKKYDAVYVGRLNKLKRHFLSVRVKNLALVAGPLHGSNIEEPAPPHVYRNTEPLSPEEVCRKINQSYCGLILSEKEGACFASSEYLLCGVPVVSTPSEGGRCDWYDDYNSIIVSPDTDAVASAVEMLVDEPRDPDRIRATHIARANHYRAKFVSVLSSLFMQYDVTEDPLSYFIANYFHKMRTSHRPNFEELFR